MKLAIIGLGHAGCAYFSACRKFVSQAEITLVDINPSVNISSIYNIQIYASIPRELFDVVIIATPPATHLNVLKDVYNNGS